MAQIMNSTHLTVVGLDNNERSALASLLHRLEDLPMHLLAGNEWDSVYNLRKDLYGY